MTQKQYIRQVSRKLRLPSGMKKDVLASLREAFASAQERGEPERAVLERLGTPAEFIADVLKSSNLTPQQNRRMSRERTARVLLVLSLILAVLVSVLLGVSAMKPANAIGYADAPTNIALVGGYGSAVQIGICAALWVAAAGLAVYWLVLRNDTND